MSSALAIAGVSAVLQFYLANLYAGLSALFGSTDHLEVAANGASAAEVLELGRGAPVHVARRA